MFDYRKVLHLHYDLKWSSRQIGSAIGKGKSAVADFLDRFENCDRNLLPYPLRDEDTNEKIHEILYKKKGLKESTEFSAIDYEKVVKALKGKGETLLRQWRKYDSIATALKQKPYGYRQFCQKVNDWRDEQGVAVNHFEREPGENLELDYAGMQLKLHPQYPSQGFTKVTVFIATMSYSNYFYAEGMTCCDEFNWIRVCNNAIQYLGGVTPIITPDNAKVAVNHNRDWIEPELNETFQHWADYYHTAILPAAVRSPKWKPNVENTVGIVTRDILVEMHEMKFFTLDAFNEELWRRMDDRNAANFKNKTYSRRDLFLRDEKPVLMPLPTRMFAPLKRQKATVSKADLTVTFDDVHYTMLKKDKGKKVEIRASLDTVYIYLDDKSNTLLRSYPRSYVPGDWVYDNETKQKAPLDYGLWSPDYFMDTARRIGPFTTEVIDRVLNSKEYKPQTFRSCKGITSFVSKHGKEALEACCKHALDIGRPTYTQIRNTIEAYAEEVSARKYRPERKLEKTMKYKVPDENYTLANLIRKQEEKLNEGK